VDILENLKEKKINCVSKSQGRNLFAYGQNTPLKILGTFQCKIFCESSGKKCEGEFVVVNRGKPILFKQTAEKLKVLRVGPIEVANTITEAGNGKDIVAKFPNVFTDKVGKLKKLLS
jgi:hypothetical protein